MQQPSALPPLRLGLARLAFGAVRGADAVDPSRDAGMLREIQTATTAMSTQPSRAPLTGVDRNPPVAQTITTTTTPPAAIVSPRPTGCPRCAINGADSEPPASVMTALATSGRTDSSAPENRTARDASPVTRIAAVHHTEPLRPKNTNEATIAAMQSRAPTSGRAGTAAAETTPTTLTSAQTMPTTRVVARSKRSRSCAMKSIDVLVGDELV